MTKPLRVQCCVCKRFAIEPPTKERLEELLSICRDRLDSIQFHLKIWRRQEREWGLGAEQYESIARLEETAKYIQQGMKGLLAGDREWIQQESSPEDNISHTYCPKCMEEVRRNLRERERKALDSERNSVKLLEAGQPSLGEPDEPEG